MAWLAVPAMAQYAAEPRPPAPANPVNPPAPPPAAPAAQVVTPGHLAPPPWAYGAPNVQPSAPGNPTTPADYYLGRRCPAMTAALVKVGADKDVTDETKAALTKALLAWVDAYDTKFGATIGQWEELSAQYLAETDVTKKNKLAKEVEEAYAKLPTHPQNYLSIREALKGVLTDEQLTRLDAAARGQVTLLVTNATEAMTGSMQSTLERIVKPPLPMTAEQIGKARQIQAKAKEAAGKLPLGISSGDTEINDILAAANQEFIKDVLTEEQRAALAAPMAPRVPRGDGKAEPAPKPYGTPKPAGAV
jgi:hypothetical protein